ncbi:hypothetical protein GAG94_01910 [Lysinibacillus sphaericus]|nr:hypothetical protein GAG94_01910 [Lysinibacillus sphaericus]
MFKKVSGFGVILSLAFSFVFLPSEAFAAQKTVTAFKNVYVTDSCSSTMGYDKDGYRGVLYYTHEKFMGGTSKFCYYEGTVSTNMPD